MKINRFICVKPLVRIISIILVTFGSLYAQEDRILLWDNDSGNTLEEQTISNELPSAESIDAPWPAKLLDRHNANDPSQISIDFNNIDINVFIKFISVVTGKNFVVDPAVQGKVTIISQDKVGTDQAYATFESVLEMHGYSAVEEGRVVKIVPWEKAITKDDVHVYDLKHSIAEDVAQIIKELPRHNGNGKSGQSFSSDKINVSVDLVTNSLIVSAKKHDHAIIDNIIKEIDSPRPMVYIEAVIMEVSLDKDLRLGTEWLTGSETMIRGRDSYIGGGFRNGAGSNLITPGGSASFPAGFSMGVFSEAININGMAFPSLSLMIQAFKQDKDVNILSIPQILTTDNKEASVVVGRNVPFQTQSSTSDNNTFNSFEYRDVGNILKIKPHITRDRLVRLDINLQLSALEDVADSRPITTKRSVDSTVIVRDKNTIVIAGLIDDNTVTGERKVPCLGDIPVLGWLARNRTDKRHKTNLYIFLKPRVIYNEQEAQDVYIEKKNHFK